MSIFKCKMCGGTIEFEPGATVGVCDSCGTKQTLPRLDDDRKANLYDRANHFRRNNDFDKAMAIYEQILNEDNTDAEAYWSLVLCRYGIEYVEDPTSHKRIPTVNRAQFTSVYMDEDYKSALQYADGYQKAIYETEAKAIDEIQKGILAISQKEEPFDVLSAIRRQTQTAVQKKKRTAIIMAALVCACIAGFILTKTVIIPNNKYNAAVALLDEGKIIEAYESLVVLNGYKDSAAKANEIYAQYKNEKLKVAEVGDIVFFGTYEQDNNTTNGKEDVEWLVLDKKDGKILVISKYALDCQKYHSSYTDITWEKCSLRKWMNDTFLNNAFSAEEQAKIQNTTVSADKNPQYSTDPGKATTDKVFLLSITEAEKYFSSNNARQCKPTKYAVANGAYANSDNGNCWWWLRSPGDIQSDAAYVRNDGSLSYIGLAVITDSGAVRPALWINLDS